MMKPQPRPTVIPAPRAVSTAYQQAMESEQRAQDLLIWARAHPLYTELRAAGIIEERSLYNIIPQDRYREYLYRAVARLVAEKELYKHPEWERLWTEKPSLSEAEAWAQRLGIRPADARRLLRFLQDAPLEAKSLSLEALPVEPIQDSSTSTEANTLIAQIAGFVQQFRLTEQQFTEFVLTGYWDAATLARETGCSLEQAQELLSLIDQLTLTEMFPTHVSTIPVDASEPIVVAEFACDASGADHLRWLPSWATERITVDPVRLQAWQAQHGNPQELSQLLQAIRALNGRSRAVLCITYALCQKQNEYLRTGDPLALRPFSQAQLARELGYHRSVVSRIVREYALKTPFGILRLAHLTPRLQTVLRSLIQVYPNWSNAQIASYLRYRYGLKLSRPAIAYHRRRLQQECPDEHAGTGES